MNNTNRLIIFAVVVLSQLFSCFAINDCNGVTVGECVTQIEDTIPFYISPDISFDARDCQNLCHAVTNCEVFRFNGTHCTLLTKDYRKDCQISAGLYDKRIDECLKVDHKQTCDLFIEEDCEYNGELTLTPPPGTVADPQHCAELCDHIEENYGMCKYWEFSKTERLCSFRYDDKRDCKTLGGPRSPSYDECMGKRSKSTRTPTTTTKTTEPKTMTTPRSSTTIATQSTTTSHLTTTILTTTSTTTTTIMTTTSKCPNNCACQLDANNFMKASSLRNCLTALGGNPNFRQIQYIETAYGHENYLDEVCSHIDSKLKYDKRKTEQQVDQCASNYDGWMYPSHCGNGWLKCDTIKNGCINPNYDGFFCQVSGSAH